MNTFETDGQISVNIASDFDLGELTGLCPVQVHKKGEMLRRHGNHYCDALIMVRGQAVVHIPLNSGKTKSIQIGPGSPIGEIGFMNGCAASADVIAQTDCETFLIDDGNLSQIMAEKPDVAVGILRLLASAYRLRREQNAAFAFKGEISGSIRDVEVMLCREHKMLSKAQKLRYEVYCTELSRNSPNADHNEKTISDELDTFAHVFIAQLNGNTIGTARLNLSSEGSMGYMEELYAMNKTHYHPKRTGIVTNMVVSQPYRRSLVVLHLLTAVMRYGDRFGSKYCYIDCVPGLLHYYQALGFEITAPEFFHPENGNSIPMRLDLESDGQKLFQEPGRFLMFSLYVKSRIYKWVNHLSGSNFKDKFGKQYPNAS
jgi:CRP-like cAMP-binding protein